MTSPSSGSENGASDLWVRWRLPLLSAVAILGIVYALYLARSALFPFIASIIVADLLYPFVKSVENRLPFRESHPAAARIGTVLVIYVLFVAGMAAVIAVTIPPLVTQGREFASQIPQIYESARNTLEVMSQDLETRFGMTADIREQVDGWISSAGGALANAARGALGRILSGASNVLTLMIGLLVVPFILFYLLRDGESLRDGFIRMIPRAGRAHTANVLGIVHKVVRAYVRAQLTSAFFVGLLVFIGMTLLGVEFAATLGLLAGIFGLIPIIGPIIGAVPGVLVALATSPNQIIWVIVVYTVVQIVENNFLSPRIHGSAVRLHPVMIMAILVIASQLMGLWGVIIGVPLTAVLRDVFVYFHTEWSGANGGEIAPSAANEESSRTEVSEE